LVIGVKINIRSSASTDFGLVGVLDRFRQIEPKILVSVEAVVYNQKVHDNMAKLEAVVKGLPSLLKVVIFPHVATTVDYSQIPKAVLINDFLKQFPLQEPAYEHLPFEHPLVILFSSGTTGILPPNHHRNSKMYRSFPRRNSNPTLERTPTSWKHG
jgi:acetoacetyl-CoA synthetase